MTDLATLQRVVYEIIEDNGNPFEDPNEILQRKKSIETMAASTITDDFTPLVDFVDLVNMSVNLKQNIHIKVIIQC